MKTHKDLKNLIQSHNLVSSMDHIIACDKHGWTDLRFTKLDDRLTPESKYLLAININHKPYILYYDKLLDLRHEIDEKMIKNSYIKGYDVKNNRVHLHYENDGVFRVGNKNGPNTFRVQFEKCSLKELAKRQDYYVYLSLLESKERHRSIQVLLSELGISLGFTVKLAKNDSSSILNKNIVQLNPQKFLDFHDIDLGNITEKQVKKDIDLIDVLWCDSTTKKIIVAFEVEFGSEYAKLFQRFSSLIETTPYPVNMIVVGTSDNFANCKTHYNRRIWQSTFALHNIKYLSLNDLCDILTLERKFGQTIRCENIYNALINDKSLPLTPYV